MSRYIDADEFGRCLQNYRPYVDSGRFNAIQTEVNQVLDCIEYEIEDAPTIDIVHCGECKYWTNGDDTYGICYRCANTRQMKADDFCSYGERNCSEKPNNCDTCRFELYCPEMCEGCCEWDSHYEPKDEPQTERSSE